MKNFKLKFLSILLVVGQFFISCQNEELEDQVQTVNNQEQFKEGSIIIENGQEYLIYEGEKIPHTTSNTVPSESDIQFKGQTNLQWFRAQEAAGGHCIERHWNKSEAFLRKRSVVFSTSFYTDEKFPNKGYSKQNFVIGDIRALANDVAKKALAKGLRRHSMSYKTYYMPGAGFKNNVWRKANGITVVVDKPVNGNYYMLTAFPIYVVKNVVIK